jgi:branched-chain amino acid transport system substrate-binding protein
MKNKGIVSSVLAGVLVLIMISFAAGETIKLGNLFPVTGTFARIGIDCREGTEIARIMQNEQSGLWGKKIEWVMGDAVDPKIALTEAERLITKEGVSIIVGTAASSCSYAASQVAEKYAKIHWETAANSDSITARGFKYLFRTNAPASYYGRYSGMLITDSICPAIGIQPKDLRIALIAEDSVYGTTSVEQTRKVLKSIGCTNIVIDELFDTNSVDLSSLIMRVKAARPDLLLLSGYLAQEVLFWRQAKDLNFNVKAYLSPTGEGVTTGEYQQSLGDAVNGHLVTSYCPPVQVNPKYAVGMEKFAERYEKMYGRKLQSVYPIVAYTGTTVLWEVLKKAGSIDPEAVRKAASGIEIPKTLAGFGVKFDSSGQNVKAACVVLQWQGGKMWTIWPSEAAVQGHSMKLPLPTWEERSKGITVK